MNQINLHFQSNTPCSIFINGNNVGIIDNEKTFFIDIICYAQSLIVSADPITKNNCYISNTFKSFGSSRISADNRSDTSFYIIWRK